MIRLAARILLVIWTLSGLAFAQGSLGRHGKFSDPNYVVTRTVSEAIISINLKTSEIVLKDWDNKPHTVKVTKETKFPTGAKEITLKDLHVGQWIRYTYRVADATALEIRVEEHPSAPAPRR